MTVVGILGHFANPQPWTEHALCAQTDAELFFLEKGGSDRRAKLICQECPVRTQCLMLALKNHEPAGVWGGKSPDERAAIRRGAPITWRRIRCNHGHDIATVGTTQYGCCKACVRHRAAKDRQRKANHH
jgi:WhiB family transcriptional regulator, redox-sensing transcriptional regulator